MPRRRRSRNTRWPTCWPRPGRSRRRGRRRPRANGSACRSASWRNKTGSSSDWARSAAKSRSARGFGCKVTGINRNGRADQDADATATLADLPKLLPTADVVVLAAARTEETTDLVNDKFVAAMKPGSIIVNIARGELIVDDALLAGLDKGTPGLAILDVFRQEPLPKTHPYWKHPKVRVTGHTSSSGTGTLARADNFFLENLRRYQAGQPLLSPVGPDSF